MIQNNTFLFMPCILTITASTTLASPIQFSSPLSFPCHQIQQTILHPIWLLLQLPPLQQEALLAQHQIGLIWVPGKPSSSYPEYFAFSVGGKPGKASRQRTTGVHGRLMFSVPTSDVGGPCTVWWWFQSQFVCSTCWWFSKLLKQVHRNAVV